MSSSNKILIGIFAIVLIALNLYFIPQQKKVQLQLDKHSIWEMPTSINPPLSNIVLGPNSLIQPVYLEPKFKLQSFDLKTGELMHTKVFSEEVGAANKVICIANDLYVVFVTSAIYKLNATTLEVIWRTDWTLEIYNWTEINVEQSKDLILIASSNPYWNFYTFLNQETGEIYARQKTDNSVTIENTIADIFPPLDQDNWDRYYNFHTDHFILDAATKDIIYIGDHHMMDISNPLSLVTFAYGANSSKSTHQRVLTKTFFKSRKQALFLEKKIANSFQKEITDIQTSRYSILFRFAKKNDHAVYPKENHPTDYVFLRKDASYPNLVLQNISSIPFPYLSDDYFVAADASTQFSNYQEIKIVNLKTLKVEQSYYIPFEQNLLKFFCDQNQLYVLVSKANREKYWLALPINP